MAETQDKQAFDYCDPLVDIIGKRRQPWQSKKKKSVKLSYAYHELGENKRANRVWWCSDTLGFSVNPDTERKKLVFANFCRERLCLMCAWRKSIKTFYQLSQVLDVDRDERTITNASGVSFPLNETVFLTLTMRNCKGEDLHALLDTMFDGWRNMMNHRNFTGVVKGWFRALEVTYNAKTDMYHPHFHVLLSVDRNYFRSLKYLKTEDWVRIWRVSCKLDYDPICDIRKVKTNAGRQHGHIAELAKYTVKDSDLIQKDDKKTIQVVEILSKALRGRRLFAYGGTLKKIAKQLKMDKPGDGDLVNIDEKEKIRDDIIAAATVYKWDFGLQDYYRQK
jgi:plasmid rolling circle replication initiator protein Rep